MEDEIYKIGWFSGGMPVSKKIKKASDIQVGDIYYSKNISKDKNWGETLKRDKLIIIKIATIRDANGKYRIQFIKIKQGKIFEKKYLINANKLFLFIKTGKTK